MGFKISWDADKIVNELRRCYAQAASPYNDGFSAWHCKRDLLQVKYELDAMLKDLPKFGEAEADWMEQQQKRQMWKELQQ